MNANFSISEIIGSAWEILKKNIAPFLIAFLIYGVVIMIVYFAFLGSSIFSMMSMGTMQQSDNPLAIYSALFATPAFIVGMLFFYLVAFYFAIGFYRLALQAVDNENPGVSAFKIPFPLFLNGFLGLLLMSIIITVGFFLCIFPGIYLGVRLMFTLWYIVDQKCNPIEAMTRSWERTNGSALDLFLFALVLMLINMLGYMLCGIGMIVSYPLTIVAMALLYRRGVSGYYLENNDNNNGNFPPKNDDQEHYMK